VSTPILLNAGQSERGWHRLSTALKCPQLFAYLHILGLRFGKRKPLIQGSLLHIGLAHFYIRLWAIQNNTDPNQWYTPDEAIYLLAQQEDANPPPGHVVGKDENWMPYAEQIQKAVRAYVNYWGDNDAKYYRVVNVEEQVRAMVATGGWSLDAELLAWLFTQRIDLVLQDLDGYYIEIDHKKCGRFDKRDLRAYFRDGQFQGMHTFGRNKWGAKYGGIYINRVRIPDSGDNFGFQRDPVPVLRWRMDCFPDSIRWSERVVQDLEKRGVDPWKWPKVDSGNGGCEHRYGPCEAAELCDHGPSGLQEVW